MAEPTLADVVARLEEIEKKLEKLQAIEKQLQDLDNRLFKKSGKSLAQIYEELVADRIERRNRAAHLSTLPAELSTLIAEEETYRIVSRKPSTAKFTIELDREEDGRFIAEVVELPGVLVYEQTKEEALNKVIALAEQVLEDRVEHGEAQEKMVTIFRLPPDVEIDTTEQVST